VVLEHARAWLSQLTGITDSESGSKNVQIAHMISQIHDRALLTLQTALDFNNLRAIRKCMLV